jgi:hypothetical protein
VHCATATNKWGGSAPDGNTIIHSPTEYRELLASVFGLRLAHVNALWEQVCIRHEEIAEQVWSGLYAQRRYRYSSSARRCSALPPSC